MKLETRVFELCNGNYRNLSELAQAMGLSVSQVYRVRESKRSINQKFIIGAKKAFPSSRVNKLADNADTPVLTTREAAQFPNLHINTVRRWNNQGILKAYRVGPRV